jgi:3-oxoacyl-(acyl-carrier-protein) synthase
MNNGKNGSSAPARRVVITGMGIVAPNAHGLDNYELALRSAQSGLRHIARLEELKFACQVGGIPQTLDDNLESYFTEEELLAVNESMIYACVAGLDAWQDAGLEIPQRTDNHVDWDTGLIMGCGLSGMDTISEKIVPLIEKGKVKRLGSTIVEQTMCSSVSAKLGGLLALGNQVTTNSSACNTGTESIINAYLHVREGRSRRMLAGGAEGSSPFIWGGFDAMRVLNRSFNDEPARASRPMSESAAGFIPGSGAGVLVLEDLETALERNARIYAEITGGSVNSGGHRMGGSMTAPNVTSVQRCIRKALDESDLDGEDIDYISGHLTGTFADPLEVDNWSKALNLTPDKFPWINSTKSLIGHGLGAAGAMESVAAILQMHKGFVHQSANCEDIHPEIQPYSRSIPQKMTIAEIDVLAKASFGFGDVNGCFIAKKYKA